jgi:hypothetical protein
MPPVEYAGDELDVLAHALNWKAYLHALIAPHLTGDVLEVGAGIGATTRALCDGRQRRWTCLEPDPRLAERIRGDALPIVPEVVVGTTGDLAADRLFDAVLYMDVLEHIEDDRGELARAAAHVRAGGAAIVMSPAHAWLYTAFDARIGHFRRYTRRTLGALTPAGTRLESLRYLDAAGVLPSLGNRVLLRSAEPTVGQVRIWDRCCIPISRRIDPWLGWRVGKSILGIWRKAA